MTYHVEFLGCAVEQCTFHSTAVNLYFVGVCFVCTWLYCGSPMKYEIFGQEYYILSTRMGWQLRLVKLANLRKSGPSKQNDCLITSLWPMA